MAQANISYKVAFPKSDIMIIFSKNIKIKGVSHTT